MSLTRRDVGKIALATLAVPSLFPSRGFAQQLGNARINGVLVGSQTYSFRALQADPKSIIEGFKAVGLFSAELMSNHAEGLAGIPAVPNFGRGGGGGRGTPLTPEQQAEIAAAQEAQRKWRMSTSPATWAAVRKMWNDAGIEVRYLTYNMGSNTTDEAIEYGFQMAKGLGVKGITTSTTLTMAKRIAPVADQHKLLVGYHGHDATNDANQTATLESYATLMAYGKYNGVNLDIGHFTAAGYDAVAFIKEHHAKITNLHIKDRKKDHGPNVAVWGTGDTPMKEVLQLLKKEKYSFPANLELEYQIPEGSTIVEEAKKCLAYVKSCLA
jgi:sugar phosphate isomerase/epimerase